MKNSSISITALCTIALPAVLLLSTAAAQAAPYKWTDEQGHVHYSQIPPVGRPAQAITTDAVPTQPAPATSEEAQPDEQALDETAATTPSPDAPKADKQKNAQLLAESCTALRHNLQLLENNTRIRVRDKNSGNFRVLDDTERQKKIQTYRSQLHNMCPGQ